MSNVRPHNSLAHEMALATELTSMLEGPYKKSHWQQRWLNLEFVFQVLQVIALVVLAAVFGYEWFVAGKYLKLLVIFGSGLAIVAFAVIKRSPIVATVLAVPMALAWLWP